MLAHLLKLGFVLIPLWVDPWTLEPFEAGKWAVLYTIAGLSGLILLLDRHWGPPRLSPWESLALAGVILGAFIPVWRDAWLIRAAGVREFVALGLLSLAFAREFRERSAQDAFAWVSTPLRGSVAIVLAIMCLQAMGAWDISWLPKDDGIYASRHFGTLGHLNLAAEFLGAAAVIFACRRAWFWMALAAAGTFACHSRAAELAVGAAFGVLLVRRAKVRAKLGKSQLALGLAVVVSLSAAILFPFWINKTGNALYRWQLAQASWLMVGQNPWGFGLGNFGFSAVPYFNFVPGWLTKNTVFHATPHNEYLRALVELGIPGTLAAVAFSVSVFTRIGAWGPVLAYFAVLGLFQFPLRTPVGLYFVAALLGWAFSRVPVESATRWDRAALATKLGLVVVTATLAFASRVFEARSVDGYRATEIACHLDPLNFTACISRADWQLFLDDPLAAQKTLMEAIARQPNNHYAIETLAKYLDEKTQRRQKEWANHLFLKLLVPSSDLNHWDPYRYLSGFHATEKSKDLPHYLRQVSRIRAEVLRPLN